MPRPRRWLTRLPTSTLVRSIGLLSLVSISFPALSAAVSAADAAEAPGPIAWWSFDDPGGGGALDRASGRRDPILGHRTPVAGVSGRAIRCDGYTTRIRRAGAHLPTPGPELTVEAWVALAAYPWNECAVATQREGRDTGYALSIGPRGEVILGVRSGDRWRSVSSGERRVERRRWTHVAGRVGGDEISVWLDGRLAARAPLESGVVLAPRADLLLATDPEPRKPSDIHREHGTLPSWYSIDGILDEVRIHARALPGAEIAARRDAVPRPPEPEIPPRRMPSGPPGPGTFGACYARLSYYPEWDELWRVGPDPDVVVRFDTTAARVVFWRGTRYSAAWVSEKDQWMADQSVEAWGVGANDREGCFEHMQDRRCRYSHVRIIESHAARAVVHWRYAPVSSHDHLWREDPRSGRACWVDEYYYIYPDAMGIRHVTWKTGTLGKPRQFQESLPLTHPDQYQDEVVGEDFAWVANLDGESQVLSFVKDPSKSAKTFPEDLVIQLYNFVASNRPFIVFEPGNRMHYVKDRRLPSRGLHVPGACNHWPVGQAACDGRTVRVADRPTHFLGFPISSPPVHEHEGRSWWNGLYGMTTGSIETLVPVARSWCRPPGLTTSTQAYVSVGYDRSERAYRVRARRPGVEPLVARLAASDASPAHHPVLVVEGWGDGPARLEIDGTAARPVTDYRIGHRRRLETTDLIVWTSIESTGPVELRLSSPSGANRPDADTTR